MLGTLDTTRDDQGQSFSQQTSLLLGMPRLATSQPQTPAAMIASWS